MNIPRLMFAAPSSGSGKTLITCAMLGALKEKGMDVVSIKCGPDYIDPMFHRSILKVPTENLDTFFTDEEQTKELFLRFAKGHEIAVFEGVMGVYDGLGGVEELGSSYHLAKITKTPIILVADVHGMGKTMIPMLQGLITYDTEHLIKGIILNRISKNFYETIEPLCHKELSVPVVGFFEKQDSLKISSRHLGLILPTELAQINEQLELATSLLKKMINIDQLIQIAGEAEEFDCLEENVEQSAYKEKYRLAVARDEAFCFYYEANLKALEACGIELVYFSPLHDKKLPKDICGIMLGGGYPELNASELSANIDMLCEIRQAIANGMPSYAECGGFMYLHEAIIIDGISYPMVGAISGTCENKGKLVRFGYVEIQEKSTCFLNKMSIKGHEFHYYDSTNNGSDCIALKPTSGKCWESVHVTDDYWWGYAHLYLPSNLNFANKFKNAMEIYWQKKRGLL